MTPAPENPPAFVSAITREAFLERTTPEANSGCWLWTGSLYWHGYGQARSPSLQKCTTAHRVSWELFHGVPPQELDVCHKCDTRACVNPDHLFLGSRSDNMQDCARKGRLWLLNTPERIKRGVHHPRPTRKLTDEQVVQVRQLSASGLSDSKVGANFGIVSETVRTIRLRLTWAHIP